jgi:tripartite-type tricarboxylate transporter receptor subunit TctC
MSCPSPWRRLLAICLSGLAAGAAAQSAAPPDGAFPARPVTLIVPFPAGGPSDALARGIAQKMSVQLEQPVVIENLGGANGVIGLNKLLKAAPDGYTIAW